MNVMSLDRTSYICLDKAQMSIFHSRGKSIKNRGTEDKKRLVSMDGNKKMMHLFVFKGGFTCIPQCEHYFNSLYSIRTTDSYSFCMHIQHTGKGERRMKLGWGVCVRLCWGGGGGGGGGL